MPTERACGEQMAVIRHRRAPDDGAFPTLSSERAQTNLTVGSCPVTAWASYTACSELCALVSLGQRDWFPEWETWNNAQPLMVKRKILQPQWWGWNAFPICFAFCLICANGTARRQQSGLTLRQINRLVRACMPACVYVCVCVCRYTHPCMLMWQLEFNTAVFLGHFPACFSRWIWSTLFQLDRIASKEAVGANREKL